MGPALSWCGATRANRKNTRPLRVSVRYIQGRAYYLAGEIIVSAIFKYRGMDWSALRKLSLTVAFALTIITPDTVVAYSSVHNPPGLFIYTVE